MPSVSSISPSSATAGRPPFTLTVNGGNFVSGSMVRWNGSDRTTTFVSGTQLTASIPASDIAAPGTAQVTVFNPAPGGGSSGALPFTTNNQIGVIARVSVASDGTTPANGDSFDPVVSANGRFVAFASEATNLVPGGTSGFRQIFVRDTCAGATGCMPLTTLVSAIDGGTGPATGGPSDNPWLSADGRFVAFESDATNLVPGQTDPVRRIFLRDTSALKTTLVSVASVSGQQPNGSSFDAAISDDGRFVTFASQATNLVSGDTNNATDIFVRDTCVGAPAGCTPSTVRASVAGDGTQANHDSFDPMISGNGRFVAFESDATNLVSGQMNPVRRIFVRDTCTGVVPPASCTPSTKLVSAASDSTQQPNGDSFDASISADGRFVAFASDARNLVPGGTNIFRHMFVRDTCASVLPPASCTPSTALVSATSDGIQGDGPSLDPTISSDGRFVAFQSDADNLVSGDTNNATDIFVRDTCVGAPAGCTPSTLRASVAGDGTEADGASFDAFISGDGRFVVFESGATNLIPGGTNGKSHIFLARTGH